MTEQNEAIELINEARAQARSEGLKNFFRDNGKNISRIVIIALVIAIGYFIFKYYQSSQQEKYSAILHQSLLDQQLGQTEKYTENLKKIIDAKSAPSGVKSLASLRYAAFLLDSGNKNEAAELYLKVNDCGLCDKYVRDLGGLLAVRVWMSDDSEIAKDDLSKRIEKIENKSATLRYFISEQRGILEMEKNNLEKSYQIFDAIGKNPESQQILKTRAADFIKMLVGKGYQPKITENPEVKETK